MLKKLSTLVFLCALCVWAADVWTPSHSPTGVKKTSKVLSDSPWTAKIPLLEELPRSQDLPVEAKAAELGAGAADRRAMPPTPIREWTVVAAPVAAAAISTSPAA
jgi:hypothetical protein